MDYKESLHLPSTNFDMKANLPKKEVAILDEWKKIDIYKEIRKIRSDNAKYILHDGPPYANGHIHAGTALNKILKDIIVKSKTMLGFNAPFVPGWDCHGLPIELNVDKKLGKKKQTMQINEIRNECKKYAEEFINSQKDEFKRLGIFADWEKPYLTFNKDYEIGILKLLSKLVESRSVIRGNRPVHWCPSCATALAEAEVEYQDKESPSIFVKFDLRESAIDSLLLDKKTSLIIWTTTPWTLPANLAIAFHPDVEYGIYDTDGQYLVIAVELAEKILKLLGIENYSHIKTLRGIDFENLKAKHPFIDRHSLMILGNHVGTDQGTGIVHTAPGHGLEDYIVGLKYNLEIYNPVNQYGRFVAEVENLANLSVWEANEHIVKRLSESGHLLKVEKIKHSYPHCWRCRKPLIFRATPQWFISMERSSLRDKLLREIENVNWLPSWGKGRIKSMLELRPDWCISRQRIWGTPITAFECTKCSETIFNSEIANHVINILDKNGIDFWFSADPSDLIPKDTKCPNCANNSFVKSKDILDVWFDSGASQDVVLRNDPRLSAPADLYLEGSDQHRGWFQTSLICSVGSVGKAPYKEIITHGYVVDGSGKKMSKMFGNVVRPQEIIEKYGAEIVRLWAASEDYREDIRLSDEILKRMVDAYRKIRNTIRFMLGNISDFDPDNDYIDLMQRNEIDRYIMTKLRKLSDKIIGSYNRYEFHTLYHQLHNFCVVDLSSFYLDVIKDRIYTYPKKGDYRLAAQSTLYDMVIALTKLMAPVLSFTSEEIWSHLKKTAKHAERSIHFTTFEKIERPEDEEQLLIEWDRIVLIRNEVLKALENERRKKLIGHSLDAKVYISAFANDHRILKKRDNLLAYIFIVSMVDLGNLPADAVAFKSDLIPGLSISIEKAGGEKCPRCWNYSLDIGTVSEYPELCTRCAKNLS